MKFFHFKLEKKQTQWMLSVGTAMLMLLWLCAQPVILEPDSGGYIDKSFLRSPIYPLLIALSQTSFGAGAYLPVILFQSALVLVSALMLTEQLKHYIKMDTMVSFIVFLMLTVPYIFRWGNVLLTQGIALGLFLLSLRCLFKGLIENRIKSVLYFFAWLTLLVLTRRQFMFMYVIGAVAIGYLFSLRKCSYGRTLTMCVALIASFVGADLSERMYHLIFNKQFSTVPFLGVQLVIAPLYLSSQEDVVLFNDEKEKQIFSEVYQTMNKRCINARCQSSDGSAPPYQHYYLVYNTICWGVLSPIVSKYVGGDWILIDKTLTHMSLKLIAHDWKKWLRLYLSNIQNNIGGSYFGVLLVLVFFISIYYHFKNRDPFSLLFSFVLLLTFGNYSLIALVEPAMFSYNFYTNSLLISFLFILIFNSLKYKSLSHAGVYLEK